METRLCNIFKTTNDMALTDTISKVLIELYKVHEKEQPSNGWYTIQRPFNFRLLLTVKFL